MATKKDLVEAYSFSRRRLITAFVSGAPGGREVEPNRPGRTIVGGIALAILLVAGAAVLGILKSPTEIDWDSEDLVSDKESGADYVLVTDDETDERQLRPIANITSAMLLFGPDVDSTDVPRDELATQELGPPIGILEAPSVPPETGTLIPDGWTACSGVADDGEPLGVKLHLAETPQVRAAGGVAFVVRSEGAYHLVAEAAVTGDRTTPRAFTYAVPEADAGGVFPNVAGTDVTDAIEVAPSWLALFPAGGPLTLASFGLTRDQIGRPPQVPIEGAPEQTEVGDVLVFGEDRYAVADRGAVRLTAFSAEVYDNLAFPRNRPPDLDRPVEQAPAPRLPTPLRTTAWPDTPPSQNVSPQVCAELDTESGLRPDVRLATDPGPDAGADAVRAGERLASVEDGHGAFVLSGDFDSDGSSTPTLIDSRAIRYTLAGPQEREQLGYAGVDDVVVPYSWLQLLTPGVTLSVEAAKCPPTSSAQTQACPGSPE